MALGIRILSLLLCLWMGFAAHAQVPPAVDCPTPEQKQQAWESAPLPKNLEVIAQSFRFHPDHEAFPQGSIRLWIKVSANGCVKGYCMDEAPIHDPVLRQSALEALQNLTFEPVLKEGKAVQSWYFYHLRCMLRFRSMWR